MSGADGGSDDWLSDCSEDGQRQALDARRHVVVAAPNM